MKSSKLMLVSSGTRHGSDSRAWMRSSYQQPSWRRTRLCGSAS